MSDMPMSKPKFNPNAPYQAVNGKPAFSPDMPYEALDAEPEPPSKKGYEETLIGDGMHPEFSLGDRYVVKNFSSSPDAGIGYLKKKYPEMELRKTRDGEIVGKNTDDSYFRRLDEKGTSFADVGDVAYDVLQGGLEAAGGTLAGLGTMNPVVGAATAGGIGVASELAKQGIGSAIGIPGNFQGSDLATSGVLSAALPVVGKGVKSAWTYGKNTAGPKIGSWLSGIGEDVIRNINTDREAREFIKKNGQRAYIEKYLDDVNDGLSGANNYVGKNVENATGTNPIDIKDLKSDLGKFATDNLNPRQQKAVSYINDELIRYPDVIDPKQARELKRFGQAIVNDNTDFIGKSVYDTPGSFSNSEVLIGGKMSKGVRDLMEKNSPDPKAFNLANEEAHNFYNFLDDKRLSPFRRQDVQGVGNIFDGWGVKGTTNADQLRKGDFERLDNYVKLGGKDVNSNVTARGYQSYGIFDDPEKLTKQGKAYGLGSGIGGAAAYASGGGAATGIVSTLAGGVMGGFGGSPYVIKKIAESAPKLDKKGEKLARIIYQNPYMRTDKATFNLMQNENNR